MGRPKLAIPSIEKNISIPEDVVVQVDLKLFSTLESKVPHGAWSRYITALIREDLKRGRNVDDNHTDI